MLSRTPEAFGRLAFLEERPDQVPVPDLRLSAGNEFQPLFDAPEASHHLDPSLDGVGKRLLYEANKRRGSVRVFMAGDME